MTGKGLFTHPRVLPYTPIPLARLGLPIAISTAHTLGVDPKPFLIGICFGASACYATPIGYQTNLLE
jgi:hypothetical protein